MWDKFRALIFLWLVGLAPLARAVVHKSVSLFSTGLDYVILNVNQETRYARSGETIAIYLGDQLSIRSAVLLDPSKKTNGLILDRKTLKQLSLHKIQPVRGDLTGLVLDSSDFQSKQGPTPEIDLVIRARSASVGGFITIRILNPILNYVELAINKQKRIVREGEIVRVLPDDLFKVFHVATNLPKNEQVFYQVVQDKNRIYLQFARKKVLFGTVTLEMEP